MPTLASAQAQALVLGSASIVQEVPAIVAGSPCAVPNKQHSKAPQELECALGPYFDRRHVQHLVHRSQGETGSCCSTVEKRR